jgi:hypothetical protein
MRVQHIVLEKHVTRTWLLTSHLPAFIDFR